MRMGVIHVLVILSLIGLCLGSVGDSCRRVSQCGCGEQCVNIQDLTPCQSGEDRVCACLKGCAVAEVFIPAGISRRQTYGNTCRCPIDSGTGIPSCTRMMWRDLPDGIPLYYENPICHVESGGPNVFLPQSTDNDGSQGFYAGRQKKSWRYPPKRIVVA
ncbi:hypothetical protein ACF0H5_000600 [Mactra antiquata]